MSNENKSLIVIPTYNEIQNIEKMISTIFSLYPKISLLIVDDNSPDETGKKVQELQKLYPQLHLLQRSGKLGLGTAYIEGFTWGLKNNFEYLLQMDCDFSHDPKDIKNLLSASVKHDLIIGSRYIEGIRIINWPLRRLLLSYAASIYTQTITGMPVKDATGGMKCFSAKVLKAIDFTKIYSNGYSFQIEMNFKTFSKNFSIQEVPIIFYERRNGQSKMNFSIILEAIFVVFRLRFHKILGIL